MTLLSRERVASALASVMVLGAPAQARACMNEMVSHGPSLVVPILGVGTLLLHALSLRYLRSTRERITSLMGMALLASLAVVLTGPGEGGPLVVMLGVVGLIVAAHLIDGFLSRDQPAAAPAQAGGDDQATGPVE